MHSQEENKIVYCVENIIPIYVYPLLILSENSWKIGM